MSKQIKTEDLRFVDEQEVPEISVRTQWEEIFGKIPRGKALVLQHEQAAPSTVRTALKRHQKKGKFKNLFLTTRKVEGNKYVSYVVNPSKVAETE